MDTFCKKREKVSAGPYTHAPCSCYNRSRKEARHWYSSSIPFSKAAQAAQHLEKKELYDAIYQREKERAKSAAGQEARERFSQCPVCRRLVCDACFLICDEMDLCRECAARMEEPGEPVAP